MAYFVYELVSESKKRLYISITDDLGEELGRLRRNPPEELAGWPHADTRKPRIVEVVGTQAEACAFARKYASRTPEPGWKILFSREVEQGERRSKDRKRA